MEIVPQIFTASVMHKRLFPKVNQFKYGVYYIALPLGKLDEISQISINRFGILSFYEKDYIIKDLDKILSDYKLDQVIQNITLITMPRIFGYAFNPVSFFMCFDRQKNLRAVICEVHNTFGEVHSYICAHEDSRIIAQDDWFDAEKLFHVSPFLKREGNYKFRFALNEEKLGIWIDFYDVTGKKQLITSLTGKLIPLTKPALRSAFWKHPLVTLKTIYLIHWQALKLIAKGIKHIRKPEQLENRISSTNDKR